MLVVILALAGGVVACGGDGDDGGEPGKGASADAFVAQAKRICIDLDDEIIRSSRSTAGLSSRFEQLRALIRSALRDVEALEPGTPEQEELVSTVIDEVENELLPAMDGLVAETRAGDTSAFRQAATRIDAMIAETETVELAREARLHECVPRSRRENPGAG